MTLMAFILLLSLSLTTLTRVEVLSTTQSLNRVQAQQNALLGLQVALGKVQQLAGSDQRVTARADLVADVANPYFTGVWDTTSGPLDPAIPLAWLVSGQSDAADNLGNPSTDDTVVWMLHESVDASSQVKVLSESIGDGNGRFAYWIGDEGTKANAKLTDPWESPDPTVLNTTGISNDTAKQYRYISNARSGIEGMSDSIGNDLGTAYDADDPDFKSSLNNVQSLSQLPLSANSVIAEKTLHDALAYRFHDLTTTSRGVLANVVDGGLKKDLTAWLAQPDSAANPPRDTDYITEADTYLPTWGMIREYAEIIGDGNAYAPIAPDRIATSSNQSTKDIPASSSGLHPYITYTRIGFNVSNSGEGQPMNLHIFPVVVLWNPYNVPIAAHDYTMLFDTRDNYFTIIVGKESEAVDAVGPYISHPILRRATSDKAPGGSYDSQAFATGYLNYPIFKGVDDQIPAEERELRFRLNSPQIEPGQSLVFTLDTSEAYNESHNVLSPNQPIRADNSVTLPGPIMSAEDLHTTKTDDTTEPVAYYMGNGPGQMVISLRDADDEDVIYQHIQSPGSTGIYSHSPVNSPFNFENRDPGLIFEPLLYCRIEMRFSEDTYGAFGQHSRWIALFNPIAPDSLRPRGTGSHVYYMDIQGSTHPGPSFGSNNRGSVGPGPDVGLDENGNPVDMVVKSFRPAQTPIFSLAQLQHANLSLMTSNPTYAVGNSLADPWVPREQTVTSLYGAGVDNRPQYPPFRQLENIYDLSYTLNEALWDDYFFSTVPNELTTDQILNPSYFLPNARNTILQEGGSETETIRQRLTKPTQAASALMVEGAFNVNSTSVEAWKALLHSRNGIIASDSDTELTHSFPRYLDSDTNISTNSIWSGNRALTDAQIDHLAEKIVEQVRLRGPFSSMADFVNRRLANDETGLKGPLQAAIDSVDSDPGIPNEERINGQEDFTDTDKQIDVTQNVIPAVVIRSHWIGSDNDDDVDKPFASRAAFAPGYLTQADLLTTLSPVLTARSDTFIIRCYGDVRNPISGEIESRAWCEATVQRLPYYLDDNLDPWETPQDDTTNDLFGRRFQLVSFRWLATNEI
ncbi:hypothetical protein GCM10007047_20240 [Cerasicoccus arenae]|uniref:Verru_Chthon cassette protein A n=2 Tax=Cerasicoccus arenae TaxID=424488 RepID=A0A8J3GD27_9BACT|nr:hypothetical protein GCM10007047_20240 [Cerasicoccus arenae]